MNKIAKITALVLAICLVWCGIFSPETGVDARVRLSANRGQCLGPWLARESITYFMHEFPVFKGDFMRKYNSGNRLLNALGRSVFLSFYFELYTRNGTRFSQLVEFKELLFTFALNSPKFRFFGDVLTEQESMNLFLLGYYIDGLEQAAQKAGLGDNLEKAVAVYEDSVSLVQLFRGIRKTLKKNARIIYGPGWADRMLEYYDDLMSSVEAGLPRGTKTKARESFEPDKIRDVERYIKTLLEWTKQRTAENDDSGFDFFSSMGEVVYSTDIQKTERQLLVGYLRQDKPGFGYFILFNHREDIRGVYRVGPLSMFLDPGQVLVLGVGPDGEIDYLFNSLDANEMGAPQNWDWFIHGPVAACIQCAA